MAEPGCTECPFRAKYDNNPKSILGRLWRWHINFCPGWKEYFTNLPENDRIDLAKKYSFNKYQ